MKKIVLALAVLFSVALVSCNKANKEAADSDSVVDSVEVVDSAPDTAVDTAVAAPEAE